MSRELTRYPKEQTYYSDDFPLNVDKRTVPGGSRLENQLHWHEYFEVEFICGGEGSHHYNQSVTTLHRGSAYFIRPVDFHDVVAKENTPLRLYHIAFDSPALSPEVTDLITATGGMISVQFTEEESDFIEAQCAFLLHQFQKRPPGSRYAIRAGVEQLLLMLLQRSEEYSREGEEWVSPLMQQIITYIRFHFRSPLHLYDLAKLFHLSTNYLGELFYTTIGVRFQEYLTEVRLEYARTLLLTTELTVSQVCFESGFHTVSHFIGCFRKKYNTTPGMMRKKE